jgi:hypothetical protein
MNNSFNPNRPWQAWQVGKYHIEDHELVLEPYAYLGTNVTITFLKNTCEHCKFWEQWNSDIGKCHSADCDKNIASNDEVFFVNTFGCIFWEGKE